MIVSERSPSCLLPSRRSSGVEPWTWPAQGEPVAQDREGPGDQRVVPAPLDGRDDVDAGRAEGLTSAREAGAGRAAPQEPGPGDGDRDPQACVGLLRAGERAPKIGFRLVLELAADGVPVAVACRVLKVSRARATTSGAAAPPSARAGRRRAADGDDPPDPPDSRGTYGAPRVHAELRLGLGAPGAAANGSPG